MAFKRSAVRLRLAPPWRPVGNPCGPSPFGAAFGRGEPRRRPAWPLARIWPRTAIINQSPPMTDLEFEVERPCASPERPWSSHPFWRSPRSRFRRPAAWRPVRACRTPSPWPTGQTRPCWRRAPTSAHWTNSIFRPGTLWAPPPAFPKSTAAKTPRSNRRGLGSPPRASNRATTDTAQLTISQPLYTVRRPGHGHRRRPR